MLGWQPAERLPSHTAACPDVWRLNGPHVLVSQLARLTCSRKLVRFGRSTSQGLDNELVYSKVAFEESVRGLIGVTINSVDYWDVHNFSDEPSEWDHGDWHHAAMGVQLNSDAEPITVIWTNRFTEYGVEVFRDPIETQFTTHEEGPQRIGPDGPSAWDRFLGHPVVSAATLWETVRIGPPTIDGQVVGPARDFQVPSALQLEFDSGSVWFVAAMPMPPDLEKTLVPGDEIMVVFSEETMQAIGFDRWSTGGSGIPDAPEFAPKVIELLAAVVACGGEAVGSYLAERCRLTRPQLKRQLDWMEEQDLVNQVHAHDGRTWVRATAAGRAALAHAHAHAGK